MRAIFSRAAAASLLMWVAACASKEEAVASDEACPDTGILENASQQIRFPAGRVAGAAPVYEARIAGVSADSCHIDANGAGVIDLRLVVQLSMGNPRSGTDYPVDYFVAIVGPTGQILSRQAFRVAFTIPMDRRGASANEALTLSIPHPEKSSLAAYRIYAALQLTPEELEYNRQAAAR